MTGAGVDAPYIEAGCGPAETVAAANAGSCAAGAPPFVTVVCRGLAGSEGGGGGREGTPGPAEGPMPGPMEESTLMNEVNKSIKKQGNVDTHPARPFARWMAAICSSIFEFDWNLSRVFSFDAV